MTSTPVARMIAMEILKLRRSRSVMALVMFITVGIVMLGYGVAALQHAADPAHHGPAGALKGFGTGVRGVGDYFGMLAAILIGAEAGTVDRASGVFRDLVLTGRSRLALFFVRVPAAIAVTWLFELAAYLVVVVATFLFAGGHATPSFGLILRGAAWIAVVSAALAAVSIGVGSATGSRALTLTGVIGFQAIITPVLLNSSSLGEPREALLTAGLNHFIPVASAQGVVAMGAGVAIVVIVLWSLAWLCAGAWRTSTQDA